ncbi:putative calcium-binding protein EF-hand domain protein [Rubellimicrobium mesophilum DSM 19309]|uniref:Putative calcium-binding protein EF-hand domain protein n=1 Tax=Rubellimicrobium mesophilum DSM 19309 TaxID=442562 RepID=A0A017HIT5_9RHOB|nr:EF-hand domain-containing protein [Rubellimicrobium mesophilum]EYD74245.1 putative calcium-binding protein EF-hand domain protein [Rubellimicrobium mesophilum DSM 19309]
MKTTFVMAGLLAGLVGTAVLAQTATAPDAATARQATAPTATSPDGGRGDGLGRSFGPFDLLTADTDGDGAVTQEEVTAQRQARFEADGNDGLSAKELLAMEDAMREEARAAAAAQRVAQADDDGDGLLQVAEIEARTPQIAPLFDRLDTDGDGAISQAELDAGFGRGGHRYGGPGLRGERADGALGGLFGGQQG